MPYDYTPAQITERASSGGKDPGRKATADSLLQQALAGDKAALAKLVDLSGAPGDPNAGDNWATADARNYGKMLLTQINSGYQPQYDEAHDGSFNLGHTLGGFMKVAAPFAGLIPGVGIPLGAALSAGGSALGGALSGDKFDLGKTLMAGVAGGVGAKLNPLGTHIPGAPTDVMAGLQVGGGGPGAAMTQAATGGGGGILDKVLGAYKTPTGGVDFEKILGTVGTIGGGIQAAHMQDQANDQREAAVAGATNDWNARQPLRDAAMQRLLAPPAARPDLTAAFADPGNPWYRKPLAPAGGY